MSLAEVVGVTAFILILFLGLFSTIFGFPGTVIILGAALIYSCITGFQAIGIKIILCLIVISVIAESIEFLLGAAGAKKLYTTKRGVIAAILGGIAGAVLLTPFFLGLGTILGALLGSFIGIYLIEIIEENKMKSSARASLGALIGRITGSFVKGIFALVMVIIVLSAIYS